MTLFKQIILIIVIFTMLILVAVGIKNYQTANEFINSQLSTNARHTAISLGLAIQNSPSPSDAAISETMINSIFDSGYYERIKLVDTENNVIVDSYQEPSIEGVPDWFIKFIKLKAPIESSEIMDGWTKFGTIYVQENSGLAYQQLWNTLKDVFSTLVFIAALVILLAYFGLKFILKPLDIVREQAEAILNHEFKFQNKIPFTIDIKRMVLAMNSMVGKVQDIFNKETETLNKYQELLYKDTNTPLANRRYFFNKFKDNLASEEFSSGSLILLSIKDLNDINTLLGFEAGQKFIYEIGDELSKFNSSCSIVSRLNEDDFVMVTNLPQSDVLSSEIIYKIKNIFDKFEVDKEQFLVNLAVVNFTSESSLKDLLSLADTNLIQARDLGNFEIKFDTITQSDLILGKQEFKEYILDSMSANRFLFVGQKVLSKDGRTEHMELYLRLLDKNGNLQMASFFMPMVNAFNLGFKLDLHVLERVCNMATGGGIDSSLAINLGKTSLGESEISQIESVLKRLKPYAKHKIYLEISNRGDLDLEGAVRLEKTLKNLGFGFGLDRFELDGKNLKILEKLSPEYIKVQARNLIDLFSEGSSSQSWQALEIIIKSKGIKLIVIGVENAEHKMKLDELGIEFMQGIYISKTEDIGR